MKKALLSSSVIFFVVFCSSCASLREAGKKVWGSSIAHLETARSEGRSATVALPPEACFEEVQDILKNMEAEVYLKDKEKGYLAAMNFKGSVDTTQVGIFFTNVDDRSTKVEVASMSPGLLRKVADAVFAGLKERSEKDA